jgi:hypothetical protein
MSYNDNISRLKKLVADLKKEEADVKNENEKSENEINEIKKVAQEKINKINLVKKKKLKTKEQKISEMQNEKMQIIGGLFLMFSQGKITKEELDKVTAIENDLSTLESKNKENQYIDKGDTKKDVLEQNKQPNQ